VVGKNPVLNHNKINEVAHAKTKNKKVHMLPHTN
jgi:hypothetical protein